MLQLFYGSTQKVSFSVQTKWQPFLRYCSIPKDLPVWWRQYVYILASETDPIDRLTPLPTAGMVCIPSTSLALGISLFLSAAVGADQYTHLGRHICDRPHRRHFCKTISDFLREEKEREREISIILLFKTDILCFFAKSCHENCTSTDAEHTVASPPYFIHLGKKFPILNHSKVKSSQSEVQIGVPILLIIAKIFILGHK